MISFIFKGKGKKSLGVTYTRMTQTAARRLALKLLGKNPHVDHSEWFAASEKGRVRAILPWDFCVGSLEPWGVLYPGRK